MMARQKNGSGELKVGAGSLSMSFILNGKTTKDENVLSTSPRYKHLTKTITSLFAFSGKYDDFAYNSSTGKYIAQKLITDVEEDNPDITYKLYNKVAEVTFDNGYLKTIHIELCKDDSYSTVYQSITFTFKDINNTKVNAS